uniref:AIG1-type G domain-containing protein n=1 Tax=Neogobius melanostomus TaxID=47308 RepID=A0A8C6WF04_9GOBI
MYINDICKTSQVLKFILFADDTNIFASDIPTMRIVTLGKTGSGKSSLANTLFREETFTVNHSANSQTQFCQSENKIINGTNIQLVDTPGFFDTDKQKDTELKDELLKCIIECAPGAHAFLLTLKVEKFTAQEEAVVEQMMNYFSKEALKFTTVMFTHGDQLPKGMKIEEWVKENKALNDLVQKCGGRCCVIDNKYWINSQDQYRNNQNQIKQLLETIYKTIEENEGNCYTNDLLQKVQLMKEREKNHKALFAKLKKILIGVGLGTLIGALLGVGVEHSEVQIIRKCAKRNKVNANQL